MLSAVRWEFMFESLRKCVCVYVAAVLIKLSAQEGSEQMDEGGGWAVTPPQCWDLYSLLSSLGLAKAWIFM